ncbi:MAG: thioredoxin [Promethearchaeota archaeon]
MEIKNMIDKELDKIRLKKANELLRLQALPKKIINLINTEDFYKYLEEFSEKIIVIDFWASWCGPCMAFAPIFERLQKEYNLDFVFLKVNVDVHPSIAERYRISSIPTTLFLKNGELVNKVIGALNYETLKNFLEKLKKDYN